MNVGERHGILRRAGPLCGARYAIEKNELLNVPASEPRCGVALR
jgi:hypothetical protein